MSIIIERRTVCDMDHDEDGVLFAPAQCLRCRKDLCPIHLCHLAVSEGQGGWGSRSIANFCRPCADELIRVAQWDAERWDETNHAGEPVPFAEEDAS
jgi:hypothetical protein